MRARARKVLLRQKYTVACVCRVLTNIQNFYIRFLILQKCELFQWSCVGGGGGRQTDRQTDRDKVLGTYPLQQVGNYIFHEKLSVQRNDFTTSLISHSHYVSVERSYFTISPISLSRYLSGRQSHVLGYSEGEITRGEMQWAPPNSNLHRRQDYYTMRSIDSLPTYTSFLFFNLRTAVVAYEGYSVGMGWGVGEEDTVVASAQISLGRQAAVVALSSAAVITHCPSFYC